MRFDTIIIGGGLSGLVGGIALSLRGERVAIFSSGKSALHYSSGSLELWNKGSEAMATMADENPAHPYAKIAAESVGDYTEQLKEIFARSGVALCGDGQSNHKRITSLGALKPAWLTMAEYATFEDVDQLKGCRVAVGTIEGYLDFYPEFVASSLGEYGAECSTFEVNVLDIEGFRKSATELRTVNISRILSGERLVAFAAKVREKIADNVDLVLLPAVFGFNDPDAYKVLSREVGCRVRFVPTVSVSVPGMRAQRLLTNEFTRLGGTFIGDDKVTSATIAGGKVRSVRSANHGDQVFGADNFVFATGSFWGRGLVATHLRVYEPVANLDVVFEADREKWSAPHILAPQPFQRFGVATDSMLHPTIGGRVVENAWAIGSLLAGADSVSEGSGGGVAVLTALAVADQIGNKEQK